VANDILIRGISVGTEDNGDGTRAVNAKAAPALGTFTNRSGTVTAGGTAQTPMAANLVRKAWFFQNNSTGDLWISFVGTAVATQPSVKISPGGVAQSAGGFVSTQALSVLGATTGQAFTLWEG
jgi:hypothetical protein